MRQSILKKTPAVYEVKSDLTLTNKENPLTNVSSMSTSKIVRFSGIDLDEDPSSNDNNNNNQDDLNEESDIKSNINSANESSGFDEETTNELRKYYRKSRTVPFRQINLIGLNGEFIVAASPSNSLVPHFTTTAFSRQPKMFPRTKAMRIVSAKTHQPSEYKLTRQNTCPTLSRTTPAATQLKAPTKYELPNQAHYYWPNSVPPQQIQQSNQTSFMNNLPRSSINYSTQSNYIKSPSASKISSTTPLPAHLLNNSPLAYKSTGSSIPLLNNRFLNTNLFFSSSYSPNSPMISADKLVNIDAPMSSKLDSSISCSNIDSYSNHLMNSNLMPSRSNSSSSLTLYTYLVQSTSNTNKSLKKTETTKASLLRTHQAKKNSDSTQQIDLSRINNPNTNDVTQHLAKSHKFSSLADNFLNASSLTTSLSRTLSQRRSVEPLDANLYESHLPPATTTTSAATTSKTSLNGLYSPLRLRTTSANTISSAAIK